MDILKKILRESLSYRATRIYLECGKPATLWTKSQLDGSGQAELEAKSGHDPNCDQDNGFRLTRLSNIDDTSMTNLVKLLVPSAAKHGSTNQVQGSLKTGALEVAGLGLIRVILRQKPYRLELYLPPAGDQFYSDALQSNPNTSSAGSPGSVNLSGSALESFGVPQPPTSADKPQTDQLRFKGSDSNRQDSDLSDSNQEKDNLGGFIPNLSQAPDLVVAKPIPTAGQGAPSPTESSTSTYEPKPENRESVPQTIDTSDPGPAVDPAPVIDFGPAQGTTKPMHCGANSIDQLLSEMVQKKASDLHLTCAEPPAIRLDGQIVRLPYPAISSDALRDFLLPIFPARNRQEFAATNDTDFAYEIDKVGRFRVNIFRDRVGVSAVLRHIPATVLSADQLGLPKAIRSFCQLSKGLVLVTGPTGSGKSTTLAAMIDLINETRSEHILTIEDPIEFVHKQKRCLIRQREIFKHTTSFSRALKAALREDPDIVLIGEMRDLETIAIAVETAETGHLVFGTLHTTTAVSTIDRIIDQFPSDQQQQIRMMLAGSLKGVVAQTLVPKIGGGRVAAHEILVTSDAVGAMIREGKNHMIPNHIQSQKAAGNILLSENIGRLVKEGLITPEDAMAKSVDKVGLLNVLRRFGIRHNLEEDKKPA